MFGLPLAPQHRVYAGFAIYSFSLGNIFPRLPDIKAAMGVDDGTLGMSLIGTPIGTLLSLTFATRILERIGFSRALPLAIPLVALGYAIAIHAPTPLAFFFLLIPVGIAIGCVEIMLNVEADRTEFMIGRRIMNRAHSFWSFGFFAAGIVGAAIGHLGLAAPLHLAAIVPLSIIGVVLALGGYKAAPRRDSDANVPAPRFARPSAAILLLFLVTLSAMLMEGASLDWSAIYMRSVFDAGPFLSGFAVAIFALSQALTRFYADHFVDRHSPTGVARALLCLMIVGVLLVAFSPLPAGSLLGFVLLGIGCGTLFPLAVSAAAQRGDRPAAINVAAFTQISFLVFLLGPPLLGHVADAFGIRMAFGIGLPLALLSLLTAGALGGRPTISAEGGTREQSEAVARTSAHQDAF